MEITNIKSIRNLVEYTLDYTLDNLDDIGSETFEDRSRVHNWRNWIPDNFKEAWSSLPEEVQLVMYMLAELEARREYWD